MLVENVFYRFITVLLKINRSNKQQAFVSSAILRLLFVQTLKFLLVEAQKYPPHPLAQGTLATPLITL